jgi:hypothetical protein
MGSLVGEPKANDAGRFHEGIIAARSSIGESFAAGRALEVKRARNARV